MKKVIAFLLLLISFTVFSQDLEPTQFKFDWGVGGVKKYLSADSAFFRQNNFLLGWHWAGKQKISTSLRVNQNDAYRNVEANSLFNNCNIIVKPQEYSHAAEASVLNGRGIQYEPTLLLNPSSPEDLVIRHGDTTRPVFGFLHRRGKILNDSTDSNFNRLIIYGDSVNLLRDSVILSDPWPSNQLSSFGTTDTNTYTQTNHLCHTLFISINLRRYDSEMSDGNVLKIELPYSYLFDSTYQIPPNPTIYHKTVTRYENIQFSAIPSNSTYPADIINLLFGRGCAWDTISASQGTRAFYISKKILPPNGEDITISAYFRLNGDLKRNNHELKRLNPENDKIDSLKIKITYLGGSPLAINWVRLETPHCQRLLRGYYDEQITTHVQEDLSKFISNDFLSQGKRFFRYNTIIEGSLQNWISEKYFNKLVCNISTCEVETIYPKHYEYYVKPPDRWIGYFKIPGHISAPYSRREWLLREDVNHYLLNNKNFNKLHNGNILLGRE